VPEVELKNVKKSFHQKMAGGNPFEIYNIAGLKLPRYKVTRCNAGRFIHDWDLGGWNNHYRYIEQNETKTSDYV
jgi:hypothetical protein